MKSDFHLNEIRLVSKPL